MVKQFHIYGKRIAEPHAVSKEIVQLVFQPLSSYFHYAFIGYSVYVFARSKLLPYTYLPYCTRSCTALRFVSSGIYPIFTLFVFLSPEFMASTWAMEFYLFPIFSKYICYFPLISCSNWWSNMIDVWSQTNHIKLDGNRCSVITKICTFFILYILPILVPIYLLYLIGYIFVQ